MRFGIIGTGRIARTFAREVAGSSRCRCVAVAGRSLEKAAAVANDCPGLRPCSSIEDLVNDPGVDAIYVATPHTLHAEGIAAAARTGRHILCEKPLCPGLAGAEESYRIADIHHVRLMEAFMTRCHPGFQLVVEMLQQGRIGALHAIRASFTFACPWDPTSRIFDPALGGGAIWDVGCYTMMVARWMAGAALMRPFANPFTVEGVVNLCPTGVDVSASALLRFPDGITAQLYCGTRVAGPNELVLMGDNGFIHVPDFWNPPQPIRHFDHSGKLFAETRMPGDTDKYRIEAELFADCIETGKEFPMSRADTLGNIAALDQWLASAHTRP